jgi:radical SAM superfamily enzyme YgiQ (UPF0313 family)
MVLDDYHPDLIGFTATTVKIKSVFKLAAIAKEKNPAIYTVLGGHHSQLFAREILDQNRDIDFIVLGEGEVTFQALLQTLSAHDLNGLETIAGLCFRKGTSVVLNKTRNFIENLDGLPWPAPCYYFENNVYHKLPINAIMASRGCPFACHYCATNSIWQRKVRMRSPVNVLNEIKSIIAEQKERYFSFYDDCFTLNKKWLNEFCDLLVSQHVRINWQCITSANLLDEDIFKKIVRAGCVKINVAIESGSERILKIANKNLDLSVIKGVFKLAKKFGISTAAYIMLGFPGETEEDIRLTQKIMREVRPHWVYCNVLMPLPGTVFYDHCVADRLIDPNSAWAGDSVRNIIANYTRNLPDKQFYELVDETFGISYTINTHFWNLVRRAPIAAYFKNPTRFLRDVKRTLEYMKWK